MFNRFILILPGVSKHYGTKKAGDFLYREEHKAFIYKGTEYPIDQFNAIVPKVVELNRDFMAELPYPRLLEAPACEVQPEPDPSITPQPSPEDSQVVVKEGDDPGRQHSVVKVAGGETDGPSGVSEAPVSTGAEATTQPEATPAANPTHQPEAAAPKPAPAKKAPAKKAAPKPKDDDQAQP